jgi:hypothetical protein
MNEVAPNQQDFVIRGIMKSVNSKFVRSLFNNY